MLLNADFLYRYIAVSTDDMKGKVIVRDGVIVFDHVPIVTPNNDVLVSIGEERLLKRIDNSTTLFFSSRIFPSR